MPLTHVFQIIDEAKELKGKIKEAFLAGDVNKELLASWTEKVLELDELEAKKLDELFVRLEKLEEEVRGKPEA